MATLFGKIFRSKHRGAGKENAEPDVGERSSFVRQSVRSVGGKSSRKERAAAGFDDGLLPATAAYHVPAQPRAHRGPRSCPGDAKYGDRSFESTFYEGAADRRHRRRDASLKYATGKYETSEYGSQDPSPVGETSRAARTFHHDIDADSDEDFDTRDKQIEQLEVALNNMRDRVRSRDAKIQRRNNEIVHLREENKQKNEAERFYISTIRESNTRIRELEADRDKYKNAFKAVSHELQELKKRAEQQQFFSSQFNFSAVQPGAGRFSLIPGMSASFHPFNAAATSSALDPVTGAGESLTDLSFPGGQQQNALLTTFASIANSTDLPSTASFENVQAAPSPFPKGDITLGRQTTLDEDDEERDDVKDFRQYDRASSNATLELGVEMLRANSARSNTPVRESSEKVTALSDEMFSAHSTLTRSKPTTPRTPLKKSLSTDL